MVYGNQNVNFVTVFYSFGCGDLIAIFPGLFWSIYSESCLNQIVVMKMNGWLVFYDI